MSRSSKRPLVVTVGWWSGVRGAEDWSCSGRMARGWVTPVRCLDWRSEGFPALCPSGWPGRPRPLLEGPSGLWTFPSVFSTPLY